MSTQTASSNGQPATNGATVAQPANRIPARSMAEDFARRTGRKGLKIRTKRDEDGTRIQTGTPKRSPDSYDRAGILAHLRAIPAEETLSVKIDCKLGDGLTAGDSAPYTGAEVADRIERYYPAVSVK